MIFWIIMYKFCGIGIIAIYLSANEIKINTDEMDAADFFCYLMMFCFWPVVFMAFVCVFLFGKILKIASFLAGLIGSFNRRK